MNQKSYIYWRIWDIKNTKIEKKQKTENITVKMTGYQ